MKTFEILIVTERKKQLGRANAKKKITVYGKYLHSYTYETLCIRDNNNGLLVQSYVEI